MTEPTRSLTAARPARGSRSTVATLALVAGFAGGLAPAALADPTPDVAAPTSPAKSIVTGGGSAAAPSAAAASDGGFTFSSLTGSGAAVHPGLKVKTYASFDVAPGTAVGAGTPVTVVYSFFNTGDMPLRDVGPKKVNLDVDTVSTVVIKGRVVTVEDVQRGSVALSSTWTARTPVGSVSAPTSTFDLRIPGSAF
ncbi:hypothetical protein [Rathayibacter sp. VKM Ac-2926]|uniref:hypothetical protein n=1 Tax=Rathayibacter sp. VKM Ac-2926 TaxID=2929477 RepID=UPI001FB3ABDF|nr:hypothetical protein [Rathayibacter sp. VKM Ac-2926]MCJ1703527.1 hypothetical protein [Rathayibacter sp. VKM Ac-2926]